MKRFSLKEYLANPSQKVVTRDGRPARVICTDVNCKYPIVALIREEDNTELIFNFGQDGLFSSGEERNVDLFFATETKVGWLNIYPEDDICATKEEALRCRANVPNARTIKITWEE